MKFIQPWEYVPCRKCGEEHRVGDRAACAALIAMNAEAARWSYASEVSPDWP